MKKIFFGVLLGCILFSACKNNSDKDFASWNENSEVINILTDYVQKVTDSSLPDFIPERDRIAVFDMDGTLCGEKSPIYTSWQFYADYIYSNIDSVSSEAVAVADMITEAAETGKIPKDLEKRHFLALAEVFAGTPVDDFKKLYENFLKLPSNDFEDISKGDEFFIPMIEICKYLQKNGFTIFICSGTDRDIVRVAVKKWIDIPNRNVIGTDTLLMYENQFEKKIDGLDYKASIDEKIVRSDKGIIKNVKANKVSQLAQELGQKPVLSFGNSSGDICMNLYAMYGNQYKSLAFMVLADDEVRENGNSIKAMEDKEKWISYGWNVISMKDDFKTIYGKNAVKKNADSDS